MIDLICDRRRWEAQRCPHAASITEPLLKSQRVNVAVRSTSYLTLSIAGPNFIGSQQSIYAVGIGRE